MLVLDQAGWHGSRDLQVPSNVTLVPLPPYAPELNPVERVWLYLRERFLSHRLLDSNAAIVDACCQAWNALMRPVRGCAGRRGYPAIFCVGRRSRWQVCPNGSVVRPAGVIQAASSCTKRQRAAG